MIQNTESVSETVAPFQGAEELFAASGGLRCATTTGYYLAAFQAGGDGMNKKLNWNLIAQWATVVLGAAAVKFYYSTASVNQLRWILAPTTFLVELVTGYQFEFESYAGYVKGDRSFVIAASCAGVNFLITSFLMLSVRKLWRNRSQSISWAFIPSAALFAYLATLGANTVRISTALRLRNMPVEVSWLNGNQLHRLEGIFIYFGFLLLLYVVSEKIGDGAWGGRRRAPGQRRAVNDSMLVSSKNASGRADRSSLFKQSFFPLLIYYATTIGIPLANGGYKQGADFWEHSFFVLVTPLLLILPLATFRFYRERCERL